MRTLVGVLCAAVGAAAGLIFSGVFVLGFLLWPPGCGEHLCVDPNPTPRYVYAIGALLSFAVFIACAAWLIRLLVRKYVALRDASRTDLRSSLRPVPLLPEKPGT
jgi:MFS family permease